ncbi:MAG TPA: hypothetical protein VMF52_10485 [Steroidobacteraceae bacterium]|nr:hypothetical protein [Steroidobacteraceae bacterium]
MKLGEWIAVVVGGVAMILACVLAGVEMARGGFAWWIVPLIAAMFWRETVFAKIRAEVDRTRKDEVPADAPI